MTANPSETNFATVPTKVTTKVTTKVPTKVPPTVPPTTKVPRMAMLPPKSDGIVIGTEIGVLLIHWQGPREAGSQVMSALLDSTSFEND